MVTTQKAAEAMEAVFSARQSGQADVDANQERPRVTGSGNGIFLDGPQSLYKPGADGLVNTADDTAAGMASRRCDCPARISALKTADDQYVTLSTFTREIKIATSPARTPSCDPSRSRSSTRTARRTAPTR